MTTRSMGRGITLTKEMYRKMGKKSSVRVQDHAVPRSAANPPYVSERIDPRGHVRLA